MSKVFNIRRGKFDIPNIGKIDSTGEVSDEKSLEIYKLPRRAFPWISLGPDAPAFLKKQKLTKEDVAKMIQNASSKEEVEILVTLSDTKTVERIAETKLKALEYDNNTNQ